MSSADPLRQALDRLIPGRLLSLREGREQLSIVLEGTGLAAGERERIEGEVRRELAGAPAAIAWTQERAPAPAPAPSPRLIAVASGKGGVGKSTLAANLTVALARMGRKVGLVDADVYGPSQPTLLGRLSERPEARDGKLQPVDSGHGFAFLSMGQLVEPGQAIAWRGPMAGNALGQLIDAQWDGAELLIVDMPPGTGDVQLSMAQKHKPAGALIVSTPQDLSLIDATRAISLFDRVGVPIIGLVENMAGYVCPHCGEASDPFGSGGAEAAAGALDIPFIGRVPLDIAIRTASDAGQPPAAGEGPQARIFAALAERVAAWIDTPQETSDAA